MERHAVWGEGKFLGQPLEGVDEGAQGLVKVPQGLQPFFDGRIGNQTVCCPAEAGHGIVPDPLKELGMGLHHEEPELASLSEGEGGGRGVE